MRRKRKHRAFLTRQQFPFSGEPPAPLLRQGFITKNRLFFVHNHGNVPTVDVSTYTLHVRGAISNPIELSFFELRRRFEEQRITATLQCAGNRRSELNRIASTRGIAWSTGAIGTAEWTGVRLSDVLGFAGMEPTATTVRCFGLDTPKANGKPFGFCTQLSTAKALSPEVLLAYAMNDKPLPPEHGYPLRLIVPGYVGMHSVKWLSELFVESDVTHCNFDPDARASELSQTLCAADPTKSELAVNCAIWRPHEHEVLEAGCQRVQGFAISGGERMIERVEVSADGGESWVMAELKAPLAPWVWTFWEASVRIGPETSELVCRAWDSAAHGQPPELATVWNEAGRANNAWHRLSVTVAT